MHGEGSAEQVPPHPLVHVEIDHDGTVRVNGTVEHHDEPAGAADTEQRLAQVAIAAVVRDYARPLGRPVRTIATTPSEQTKLHVHPDGEVSEVERHARATPAGVPPATRAQNWLGARDAERLAHEQTTTRRATSRRRRLAVVLAAGVVAVGLGGTAGVLGLTDGTGGAGGRDDTSASSDGTAPEPGVIGRPEAGTPSDGSGGPGGSGLAGAPVVGSTRFVPVALRDVGAQASPGEVVLALSSARRTSVGVVVVPTAGNGQARRVSLSMPGATTREVRVGDLPPGSYRWSVRAPGQPPMTGVLAVPDVPEVPEAPVEVPNEPDPQPPTTPVDPAPPAPAPPPDGGGGGGNGGGGGGGGGGSTPDRGTGSQPGGDGGPSLPGNGPSAPFDPDDG